MTTSILINALLKQLNLNVSIPIRTSYIISRIKEIHNQLIIEERVSIKWSVMDFEMRAREIEIAHYSDEHLRIYDDPDSSRLPRRMRLFDRKRFYKALLCMIANHDATLGISWDTIDFYLQEYCQFRV